MHYMTHQNINTAFLKVLMFLVVWTVFSKQQIRANAYML